MVARREEKNSVCAQWEKKASSFAKGNNDVTVVAPQPPPARRWTPPSSEYDFYGGTKELDRSSVTSIGILLRTAAENLQMPDCDISHFESKLKEDWFNESEHLKNRSVEFLARFMPWRLAEEVHKVVRGDV